MNGSVRLLLSLGLSTVLLTLGLGVLWLGQWWQNNSEPQVSVREIVLEMAAPPPPPAPTRQQPVAAVAVPIQLAGGGTPLPMLPMQKKVPTSIEIALPDLPTFAVTPTEWPTMAVNWDAVGINELDALPILLTPLRLLLPKSLVRRGIRSADVKLDVMIDEQGAVTLIEVVENAYPELNAAIEKLVRNSRFSAPKKADVAVRARFIWPIAIQS